MFVYFKLAYRPNWKEWAARQGLFIFYNASSYFTVLNKGLTTPTIHVILGRYNLTTNKLYIKNATPGNYTVTLWQIWNICFYIISVSELTFFMPVSTAYTHVSFNENWILRLLGVVNGSATKGAKIICQRCT